MPPAVAYCPPPLEQRELDAAYDLLQAMRARARQNLKAAGRDPDAARVLSVAWRDELTARGTHFLRARAILAELERRGLLVMDGPFAQAT